jgi:hypothetical protein
LKQRKTERETERERKRQDQELMKPGEGVRVAGRLSNPEGEYALIRTHKRQNDYVKPYDVEVLYRFNAANNMDAHNVLEQYRLEYKPDFQVQVSHDPEIKYGQPGDYKKNQDDGSKANWGVYRLTDNRQMRARGVYIRFDDTTRADAQTKLEALCREAGVSPTDYELRKVSKYELYNTATGQTVGHGGDPIQFDATSPADAESKIPRYIEDFNLPGQAGDYDVRSVLTPPAHTTTTQQTRRYAYEIFRNMNHSDVVVSFTAANDQEAMARLEQYRREHPGAEYNAQRAPVPGSTQDLERQRQQQAQQRAQQSPDHNWCIRRRDNNELIKTFQADDYLTAHGVLQQYKRDNNLEPNDNSLVFSPYDPEGQERHAQQQSAGTEWTGGWLIKNASNGAVLHRIHGIGNVQADANRHAAAWLRTQRPDADMSEIEVVPEMR